MQVPVAPSRQPRELETRRYRRRWRATAVAADQARQFAMAVASRARRDRWPHRPRNADLQVSAQRRGFGWLRFDREPDEHLVAGVHAMNLRGDQLFGRIKFGVYGLNKTAN
jgi:hypothetical protein